MGCLAPAADGLDRYQPDSRSRPTPASVRVASVDILDVHLSNEVIDGAAEIQTITAHAVVQVSGMAGVEREIGSRILNGLTSPAPDASRQSEHQ